MTSLASLGAVVDPPLSRPAYVLLCAVTGDAVVLLAGDTVPSRGRTVIVHLDGGPASPDIC